MQIAPPKSWSRFLYELDVYIGGAKNGLTTSAEAIVVYFYWHSKAGKTLDDRVLKYLEAARRRYCKDPKRKIDKALWLVKSRRGNPGVVVPKKRRLTPSAHIEAGMMVLNRQKDGTSYDKAIRDVATELRVSINTIKKDAKEQRQLQELRATLFPVEWS